MVTYRLLNGFLFRSYLDDIEQTLRGRFCVCPLSSRLYLSKFCPLSPGERRRQEIYFNVCYIITALLPGGQKNLLAEFQVPQ